MPAHLAGKAVKAGCDDHVLAVDRQHIAREATRFLVSDAITCLLREFSATCAMHNG